MKKEVLEKLITKFFAGNISPEERIDLERWYSSFETDEGFLKNLSGPEKEELGNKLLGNIEQNMNTFEEANSNKEKDMDHPVLINAPQSKHRKKIYSYSYKIAAVLMAVILLAALSYKLLYDNKEIHTTVYGQTLQVTLPDSSIVILNGNSTISYGNQWVYNGSREVYLDGEAYFLVRHTKQDQKFIVNTADQFNVEVLGTEFTVSKRKSGTRVVLNSGKVLLNFSDTEGNEQVVMKPGELVELKEGAVDYIKKEVNAEIYSSWKDKKLILDHTSLSEILIMLRENYGLEAIFVDKGLLDQKVSGSMPAENIDMLLKNIAVTYGIIISKNKNTIEIRKIPEPQASDN